MHRPIARNFAATSENKIHSDAIARRLGFTGALVPGVTVFGHLIWPLTTAFGSRWLEQSEVSTKFIKPAYDGGTLSITDRTSNGVMHVDAHNASGVLLATLECRQSSLPSVDARAQTARNPVLEDRVPITWETVQLNVPFPSYAWTPDTAHNAEYAARVDDANPLYKSGIVHPHAILAQANQALVRRFIMPAWIHTNSTLRFHALLRVDDQIEVRAVPIDKWEKKGHQFIKLYIAYVRGSVVTTEIEHIAIFRVAGGDASP